MMVMQRDPIQDVPTSARMAESASVSAVRVRVPRPAADQVLIRVAASSLNPLEYKLADLNFMGRTPPVVLGLDLAGVVVAVGHDVSGVAVGDAAVACSLGVSCAESEFR